MNKTILITRPNYDKITRYFYYWAKIPIEKAKKKNIDILDLKVEKNNRKDFERAMEKNPCLVILNGDRNPEGSKGFQDLPKEDIFDSKIVCSFACKTSRILGIRNDFGAKAYVGYNDNFIFCCNPEKSYNPLDDEIAHFFLDPPMILASELIDGFSVKQSIKKAEDLLKNNIEKVIKNKEYEFMAPYLLWDLKHLKVRGNKNVKI